MTELRSRELEKPSETRLVYTEKGKMNKLRQSPTINKFLDAMFARFLADAAFSHGKHLFLLVGSCTRS